MTVYDKIGQEITVGSIIAYGHLLSRSAGLRIGKVLAIKSREGWDNWKKVSIEEYSLTVIGINDDWSCIPPELNMCKGRLQFPDRTIVLNPATLPEVYINLLKDII
jgi:hypothetical protein